MTETASRLQPSNVVGRLTPVQDAILLRLATGADYRQVAHERGVSYQTIKNHCSNIYRRLDVTSLVEAMNAYGLVCIEDDRHG